MRLTSPVALIFSAIILLSSCNRSEQKSYETVSQAEMDSSAAPSATVVADEPLVEEEYTEPEVHEVIDYPNFWENISSPANAFEPFAKLKGVVADFIRRKDSLREVGGDAFDEAENVAHAAIMDYKKEIEAGKYLQGNKVGILDLPRILGANDSTSLFLPEAQPSFYTNGNFFFVGGAPFIQPLVEYDTATQQQIIYNDAKGRPELRLVITNTENKYHILKSVMQFKKPRLKIEFGGPTYNLDHPFDEVKGIGSLIHNFIDDIPVFFIMEDGIVPGLLKYYQEPFTQQHACYSDFPSPVFSSSKNIDTNQIIGVYIPYDNSIPKTCSISRQDKWRWSADLNNDNLPDIACVIGTYEGIELGIPEMLWFINLNGTWKIVDYGQIPSCT